MPIRHPVGDVKWAGGFMNFKGRSRVKTQLWVISTEMVLKTIILEVFTYKVNVIRKVKHPRTESWRSPTFKVRETKKTLISAGEGMPGEPGSQENKVLQGGKRH